MTLPLPNAEDLNDFWYNSQDLQPSPLIVVSDEQDDEDEGLTIAECVGKIRANPEPLV